MLVLLSPAKNLNFDAAPDAPASTKPALSKHTAELAETTRGLTRAKLRTLMNISENLADLNYQRFQDFKVSGKIANVKQAALAFNGDVYLGLDAATLSADDLAYAQDHVRILSGMYGLLRPLDAIQPYRLEMGSRLRNGRGADLYAFWDGVIVKELTKALKSQDDKTIVNLASKEYFNAAQTDQLKTRVVTPVFKEEKDGALRQLQFFAKRARGLMARWIVQNRVDSVDGLKDFNVEGYAFQQDGSKDDTWLFTRPQPPLKSKQPAKKKAAA